MTTTPRPHPRRADAQPGTRPVVVFDGQCGMCRRQMRRVRRFDWLGALERLEYDEAVLVYPEVARGELDEGIRVRFPDASVTVGVDAVRSVMVRTPAGAVFGWLLYLPGFHWLGGRVYRAIAARRRRDGSPAVCELPPTANSAP